MIKYSAIKVTLHNSQYPLYFTGLRHCDIYEQIYNFGIHSKDIEKAQEGFITTEDKFVDRYEAVYVARAANQVSIDFNEAQLYSEDIWPEDD